MSLNGHLDSSISIATPDVASAAVYGSQPQRQLATALKIVGLAVICSSGAAQAAPLPSPGTVIAPIDKPVYQPERTQTPQISHEEKPAPAVPESSLKVRVNSFRFEGNTTFSDQKLQAAVAGFEGKDLSIAEIYHVADVVERHYRFNGYLLTSVYVPAQQINSGTITLEVIEGRLGEVKIKGELDSYSEAFLARQVDDLQPGEIISDDDLERETLLMGDLPGLETRAV
ncbi:MAG: ShlB/FhaC/HecB family hemolysin secretion/activation protein, partial [Proteobacteria bacterium]|nr:ShlB/FhaC/HecB family hemolysin secretion/activation protein [Pseudomonadota bacterium]